MNQRVAWRLGRDHGMSAASWAELPEIGSVAELSDGDKITVENVYEQIEVFEQRAHEIEAHGRCYAEYSVATSCIYTAPNACALLDAYDEGVTAGIRAYRRRHFSVKYLKRRARD